MLGFRGIGDAGIEANSFQASGERPLGLQLKLLESGILDHNEVALVSRHLAFNIEQVPDRVHLRQNSSIL